MQIHRLAGFVVVFGQGGIFLGFHLHLAGGYGGHIRQRKAGVLAELNAVIHIVERTVLAGNAAGGVEVAGSTGEVGKVAIRIFFHIGAHRPYDIGGKIQFVSAAGAVGVCLPVADHDVFAALAGNAQHLHGGVGFAGMANVDHTVFLAKIIAGNAAIGEGIMANGVQALCFNAADVQLGAFQIPNGILSGRQHLLTKERNIPFFVEVFNK